MTDRRGTHIRLGREIHEAGELPSAIFMERAAAEGLHEIRSGNWPTSVKSLEGVGTPIARTTSQGGDSALFEDDGVLFEVQLWGSHVTVSAAGTDRAAVTAIVERLEQLFPPPDPSSAHEVPVTFWMYTPQGPRPSWRPIAVPAWDEIESNYAARTRDQIAALMGDFEPARGGQLVLWHGEAGTGKTFALRALAWEWREWCQIHYIVDPDSFFGEHADYLMSVLLEPPFPMMVGGERLGHSVAVTMMHGFEEYPDEEEEDDRLWRLLVMEDTGELLSADAREWTGQGLSRFLNVVDGLIGQGLRVIVLVTTNEEIKNSIQRSHDPAGARPTSCSTPSATRRARSGSLRTASKRDPAGRGRLPRSTRRSRAATRARRSSSVLAASEVLRVYRIPYSTNVERVSLALAHKGLEVEWERRRPGRPRSRRAPQRPTARSGARPRRARIADSTVILRYLEELKPEPPLFPRDEARAAELEVFLDWFNRIWKRPPNEIEAERAKTEPDSQRIDDLGRELSGSLDVFERLLAGRDYLFGDFSAADCAAFPFLKYGLIHDEADTEEFHLILQQYLALNGRYPRLQAWIRRVDARPRA